MSTTSQTTFILTPVCRLVEGSVCEPQTTDAEGRPLVIKSGTNAGQARVDFYFAVAIPKTDPKFQEIYTAMVTEARKSFPSLFDAAGNCIKPGFAWKLVDGDSQVPNANNVRPCDKEGFPGHWVLRFSSGFAPKCYTEGGKELIPANEIKDRIKRGYYIRVYGSVKGNESTQQPGIFLNHIAVEFVAYGEEIVSGPDGAAIFGGSPIMGLPAGASNIPLTPQTPISVTTQGAPAIPQFKPGAPAMPQVAPQFAPQPVAPVVQPVAANVKPAPDFLNPQPPAPPAAPVVVKYMLNGTAWPEADLRKAGYTDAHFATMQRA